MKKIYTTLVALIAFVQLSHAQWTTSGTNIYNSNTGNVGIGTSSPASKLEIKGGLTTTASGIDGLTMSTTNVSFTTKGRIASNYNGNYITQNAYYTGSNWLADNSDRAVAGVVLTANNADGNIGFYTSATNNAGLGAQRMVIDKNGNVGIGATSPNAKLDVNGAMLIRSYGNNAMVRPSVNSARITGEIASYSSEGLAYDDGFLRLSAGGGTNYGVKSFIDLSGYSTVADMSQNIVFGTSGNERLRITNAGNVSIGTTDPKGYKLAVAGSVIAESLKVKLQGSWPDFVFLKDYKLLSLTEIKTYINQNQHLPDMPSEAEVAKDGINLGEMNKLLTKKVEELTLYLIEKDQQVADQQLENKQQNQRIAALEKALLKITSK